jgi:hypothetical protein
MAASGFMRLLANGNMLGAILLLGWRSRWQAPVITLNGAVWRYLTGMMATTVAV